MGLLTLRESVSRPTCARKTLGANSSHSCPDGSCPRDSSWGPKFLVHLSDLNRYSEEGGVKHSRTNSHLQMASGLKSSPELGISEHQASSDNSLFNLNAPLPAAVSPGVTVCALSVMAHCVSHESRPVEASPHLRGRLHLETGYCRLNSVEMRSWSLT